MKLLIPLLSLILAHAALAAEEPTALVELRQGWEEARTEAQAKVGKLYLEELEELKKNFVKAGNIEAARAVDSAIKGEAKANNEPEALVKLRGARSKSLKKALTPIDKQYWQDLKKLRGDFQKQGSLAGIEASDAEIKKVLAAYKKPEAPKQVKEEAKEEDPFEGTWQVVYNNNHRRTYKIEGDDIIVVASSFGGMGETTKLKKYKKGLIVRFSLNPYTEYLYLDGNKMFIQHWTLGRDPTMHGYTHTAIGTKVEEDKDK